MRLSKSSPQNGSGSRMMSSDRKRIAAEIGQAIVLGLEDDWELIAVELNRLRTKSDLKNSRSVLFEFDAAAKLVADAIDRRFVKLLTLCQGYPARPDEVIEPVAEALRELIERLRNYGGERAAKTAPFGGTQWILTQGKQATEFAEKALEKARIDALQGYAGGRLVFPRSEWPSEDSVPEPIGALTPPQGFDPVRS